MLTELYELPLIWLSIISFSLGLLLMMPFLLLLKKSILKSHRIILTQFLIDFDIDRKIIIHLILGLIFNQIILGQDNPNIVLVVMDDMRFD